MVFFETAGENDFASIFESVALEKQEDSEREKIESMLRILDDIESEVKTEHVIAQPGAPPRQLMYPVVHPMGYPAAYPMGVPMMPPMGQQPPPPQQQRIEYYKVITDDGNIVDTNNNGTLVVDRNKVHTLDDLPKESDWDLIMGPQPIEEPLVDISAGLRVRDGEKIYTARMVGGPSYAEWKGVSFFSLAMFLCVGIAVIVLLTRLNRYSKSHTVTRSAPVAPTHEPSLKNRDFQEYVNKYVDKRLRERYNLVPSHFQ